MEGVGSGLDFCAGLLGQAGLGGKASPRLSSCHSLPLLWSLPLPPCAPASVLWGGPLALSGGLAGPPSAATGQVRVPPSPAGTEPWSFYLVNGFLNFNLVFVLALLALPLTSLMESLLQKFHGECSRDWGGVRGRSTVSWSLGPPPPSAWKHSAGRTPPPQCPRMLWAFRAPLEQVGLGLSSRNRPARTVLFCPPLSHKQQPVPPGTSARGQQAPGFCVAQGMPVLAS